MVTVIESMWKSEAIGYALLTAAGMGMSQEQLKEFEDLMEDAIQNVSRETARDEYYNNK